MVKITIIIFIYIAAEILAEIVIELEGALLSAAAGILLIRLTRCCVIVQ